jgi:hypothetical protein
MNASLAILQKTRQLIYSLIFKEQARTKATYFTRTRKMPFEELMIFMLLSLKSSTSSALRRFFADIGKKSVAMTQQSLSEARKKVNVWAFIALYKVTVSEMMKCYTQKWHGYRVYAIDGSKIALPADEELRTYYGTLGRSKTSPTAQGSILYDVLNDIVADALIEPLSTDERTLALLHVEELKRFSSDDKNLIIGDRGYASFDLISRLNDEGISFLMRVKTKFNRAIDAQTSKDGYVWLEQNGKRIHIRVIKFMRWPVETKYDIVKNKLQMENFNTRTIDGIRQDFYAAMYLTNFAASLAIDAQQDIDAARADKDNKHQYKANINELIGILKDRFVFALAQNNPRVQARMIREILDEVTRYVTPVRVERSVPRRASTRNTKFHHNYKANC